jgi:hypothetical protein
MANRRRFGGYIVHVGVLLIALGIYYSSLYESEGTVTAMPGGFGVIENKLTGDRFVAYYAGESRSANWDRMQEIYGRDPERAAIYERMLRFVRENPGMDAPQIVEKVKADAMAMNNGKLPPFMESALPRMVSAIHWGVQQRDNQSVYEDFEATLLVFPVREKPGHEGGDQAAGARFIELHDKLITRLMEGVESDELNKIQDELDAQGIKLGINLPTVLQRRHNEIARLPDEEFVKLFRLKASTASAMASHRHRAIQELGDLHKRIEAKVVDARNRKVVELAAKIDQTDAWSELVGLSPLSLVGLLKARETAEGEKLAAIDRTIADVKKTAIELRPRMRIFYDKRTAAPRMNEPVKDPFYSRSLTRDLYFILQDAQPDGEAALRFFIKPHMATGLCGLLVLIGGTVLAILPTFRKRRAVA